MLTFSEETTGGYRGSYNDNFIIATNPATIEKPSSKDNIKSIIITKAQRYHIDQELLLRIADCESGFKPDAQNRTSTASGLFQFLTSTFIHYARAYELSIDNKNDPEIQAELAARMIADGLISAWNESKSCWEYLYE